MARPTIKQLTEENAALRRQVTVALELHTPVTNPYRVGVVLCRICRDPYPCDTATALGAHR
jgi:hypothetical protein